MCGIYGNIGHRLVHPDILDVMQHRGPDGRSWWSDPDAGIALGHLRLSIIDLSENGSQPMVSPDGRVIMTYNGEIYNYRELRRELEAVGEQFVGASDSEVLLRLFSREGVSCFEKLNGIFAAAFWERDKDELTLVRDPMGVKPLYYTSEGDGLVFSSEMKAIIRNPNFSPRINPNAVLRHLGFLWSPGSETIVANINKLLPGYYMRYNAKTGQRDFHRFEDPAKPTTGSLISDEAEAVSKVRAAVRLATERQMISDAPVGAFLSGGLDSSAIVAFARDYVAENDKLQCFTIDTGITDHDRDGFTDDLPFALRVGSHLGVDVNVVKADSSLIDRLPEMIFFADEPMPDPAALNTLVISELARANGMKVLLSGAGGDDIFTGYRRHYALSQEKWWAWMPKPARALLTHTSGMLPINGATTRRIAKAFQYASKDADERLMTYFLWLDPNKAMDLLSADMKRDLPADAMMAPLRSTLSNLPSNTGVLDKMLYLEVKHFLADHNLNYADKMGMAASTEIRVPLLDKDLVRLANSISPELKQKGSIGKYIFKRAMEGILPNDVIYRPKSGFGAPLRSWLHNELKPLMDEILSEEVISSRNIFDPHAVARLVDADRRGAIDGTYTIFTIICIELWCRQYIDHRAAVDNIF